MDLDNIQRGNIFQGKVPQKVKEARKANGSYRYYRNLYNGQLYPYFIYFNCGELGYKNYNYIKLRYQRLREIIFNKIFSQEEGKVEPLS